MFSSYFSKLEESLVKKLSTKKLPAAKKTSKSAKTVKSSAKKSSAGSNSEIIDAIGSMVSEKFKITEKNMTDLSGYATESSDFLICDPIFKNFENIFSDSIPCELVKASFFVCPEINRRDLVDILVKVAHVKKTNHYAETEETMPVIPSFVIAYSSSYTFPELKESIIEIYENENVDSMFEFDVMLILGKGIVIKNWREKRSFIALETGMESLKWFFILMNEYIDPEMTVDLRSYVKETEKYIEY